MNKHKQRLLLGCITSLCLIISACGEQAEIEENDSIDEIAKITESAVNVIGELSDEESGTDPNFSAKASGAELIVSGKQTCNELAALNRCSEGVKEASYDSCNVSGTLGTLDGNVQLDYSQDDCDMSLSGYSVKRTYDLTYTSAFNRQYSVSSAPHEDYQGNAVGGGGVLTRTGSGWEIEMLGKRRIIKGRRGGTLMDVSITTASPIEIDGSLRRAERTAVGGEILISHNLANYVTSLKPYNLKWTDDCCQPVSGQLTIELSGSINNSGIIEFQGCGQAELTLQDGSRLLTIDRCQ